MIFTDTHTHSHFSRDSKISVEESVKVAIQKGLAGISFTDHLDVGSPKGAVGDYFDIPQQQSAITKCISQYGSFINIFAGIEIGVQTHNLQQIEDSLLAFTFDIVIASIHNVNHMDPYCGDYYVGKTIRESYCEYLEYSIDCFKQFNNFDVLGHYDYISRWSPYKEKTLTYRAFSDHFDTIFNIIINKEKALELNTRSFYPRSNQPPPQFDPDVYTRYRELGGEMVTVGSDAHNTERIGDNFGYYAAKLKRCGFRYITHFKERKPVFTPIT